MFIKIVFNQAKVRENLRHLSLSPKLESKNMDCDLLINFHVNHVLGESNFERKKFPNLFLTSASFYFDPTQHTK